MCRTIRADLGCKPARHGGGHLACRRAGDRRLGNDDRSTMQPVAALADQIDQDLIGGKRPSCGKRRVIQLGGKPVKCGLGAKVAGHGFQRADPRDAGSSAQLKP